MPWYLWVGGYILIFGIVARAAYIRFDKITPESEDNGFSATVFGLSWPLTLTFYFLHLAWKATIARETARQRATRKNRERFEALERAADERKKAQWLANVNALSYPIEDLEGQ